MYKNIFLEKFETFFVYPTQQPKYIPREIAEENDVWTCTLKISHVGKIQIISTRK